MSIARRSRKVWTGVAALLLLHVALALRAVSGKSVTVDEIFHLTGGYLYNRYGDYRIHPDNGVLPQRWHALPAWLGGAQPPPLTGNEAWPAADVYAISHQFFYESGNDHWPLLMQARMMNLAWSIGAGLLVFCWARKLAGNLAGFTALTLLALSPTFLAHGPLATSDMCAALLLPFSAGAFWWQLGGRRLGPMLASAAVFGLACVSKYSAVLLLPTFLLLIMVHLRSSPTGDRGWGRIAASLLVHGAAAFAIIWATFGFRYSSFAPDLPASDHFIRNWDSMLSHLGWQAAVINFSREGRLLPEGFLFGFTHTYVGAQMRSAFLAGEYSNTGWVRFFPLAFLWKSTGAELAGGALAAISAGWYWRKLRPWLRNLAPLLAWSVVYGVAALLSHLNIGHRHLLPLYPGLFIIAGVAAARACSAAPWRYAVAASLAGLQALAAAGIHPHYLAYFNTLAGGPANGYCLLVDSSLDWGQDLPGLRDWLEKNNSGADHQRVYLSYFGSGKPDYYHLDVTMLPFVNGFRITHPYYDLAGGIYCVSATMLQEAYSPERGDFTPSREREYQSLLPFSSVFRAYGESPAARAEVLQSMTEETFRHGWLRFDLLRFSRLCHYLRARPPDATVGHSILIYRLTDEEIDRVLHRRYSDWAAAVEEAGRPRR